MKRILGIIIGSVLAIAGGIYVYLKFFKKKTEELLPAPSTTATTPVIASPVVVSPVLTCKQADALVKEILTKQGATYQYPPNAKYPVLGIQSEGTETAETKILKKQLSDNGFAIGFGCPEELGNRCINGQVYAKKVAKLDIIKADEISKKIQAEENWANGFPPPMYKIKIDSELRSQLYRGGWKFDETTAVLQKA